MIDMHDNRPVSYSMEPLAVRKEVAAQALGVSNATFQRNILPKLKVVRTHNRVLIPVSELRRYLEQNMEHTIP